MADTGGCSANEATSFASVSVAKRLCRIVRAVAAAAALSYIAMITTTLWSTPHHRLRRSFSSRRSLLVSALTNYRYPLRLISAPTTPPWQRTAQLDARACAARPRGKAGSERRKACFHPGGSGFHLPRGSSADFQFKPTDFYVTHRFFVTFLVRPALLPYGKRGFRAAICKIARPQPPAAAL